MTSVPQTKPPPGFVPWTLWLYSPKCDNPFRHEEVELWEPGTVETCVVRPKSLPPYTNVYGWYWRPVQERNRAGEN